MSYDQGFLMELSKRKVYIPYRFNEGTHEFLLLKNEKADKIYLPVFLSKDSNMGGFGQDQVHGIEEVVFDDLRNIFVEMPPHIEAIVIEPFGDGIALDREALMAYDNVAHGMTIEHYQHEGIEFFRLTNFPKGLKETLNNFFSKEIGVNRAWICMAKNKNEIIPHLIIIIDFFGSRHELFPRVAEIIKPFMPQGSSFEITQFTAGMSLKDVTDSLIYTRENLNSKKM